MIIKFLIIPIEENSRKIKWIFLGLTDSATIIYMPSMVTNWK